MEFMTIDKIAIGDKASVSKTISESDVYMYAGITGDHNPAHVNKTYSENSMFGERIAHGMLTAGLISALLGVHLPGPGTIYLGQELRFTAPVKFGDTITATAEVIECLEAKNIIKLSTVCINQNGETVLTGVAKVMPPLAK